MSDWRPMCTTDRHTAIEKRRSPDRGQEDEEEEALGPARARATHTRTRTHTHARTHTHREREREVCAGKVVRARVQPVGVVRGVD